MVKFFAHKVTVKCISQKKVFWEKFAWKWNCLHQISNHLIVEEVWWTYETEKQNKTLFLWKPTKNVGGSLYEIASLKRSNRKWNSIYGIIKWQSGQVFPEAHVSYKWHFQNHFSTFSLAKESRFQLPAIYLDIQYPWFRIQPHFGKWICTLRIFKTDLKKLSVRKWLFLLGCKLEKKFWDKTIRQTFVWSRKLQWEKQRSTKYFNWGISWPLQHKIFDRVQNLCPK